MWRSRISWKKSGFWINEAKVPKNGKKYGFLDFFQKLVMESFWNLARSYSSIVGIMWQYRISWKKSGFRINEAKVPKNGKKCGFLDFFSKTSHGIFLKFGKKLQFNSRNNVTVLDFLKKIWVLDKRGIVFFFKIFCDIFSTGVHSIHLVLVPFSKILFQSTWRYF